MKNIRKNVPLHHSDEFLQILKKPSPDKAIRKITHSKPLLVFWVTPGGMVLDAYNEHHDNPPHGDRSILSHKRHKGHLRGRSAFIGDVVYIVIYGEGQVKLTDKQLALLKKTYQVIRSCIRDKNNLQEDVMEKSIFINEMGGVLKVT